MAEVTRNSRADRTTTLSVGDIAPDFSLPTHTGDTFKLSDLKGNKNVVLAFYVHAWTGV